MDADYVARKALKRRGTAVSCTGCACRQAAQEQEYADDAENALSDALLHKEYLLPGARVTLLPAVEVRPGWGRAALDFLAKFLPLTP